jgi:hypothetical protein
MCIDIKFPIIMTRCYVTRCYELNFVNSKVKTFQEGMFNKTAFIWQGVSVFVVCIFPQNYSQFHYFSRIWVLLHNTPLISFIFYDKLLGLRLWCLTPLSSWRHNNTLLNTNSLFYCRICCFWLILSTSILQIIYLQEKSY